MITELWDRETFVANLRAIGARAYHDKHPFHLAMNEGRLSPESLRGWVANRFCYQRNIPIKDAAILSTCPVREVRRVWIHRILDHDGNDENEGGIEAWLRLGEACGLSRDELLRDRHLLPGVRFAVDAYVNFARTKPWPIAIASSLTELFAPDLMVTRLTAFEKFYSWIDPRGLDYFRRRTTQRKSTTLIRRHLPPMCAKRSPICTNADCSRSHDHAASIRIACRGHLPVSAALPLLFESYCTSCSRFAACHAEVPRRRVRNDAPPTGRRLQQRRAHD